MAASQRELQDEIKSEMRSIQDFIKTRVELIQTTNNDVKHELLWRYEEVNEVRGPPPNQIIVLLTTS